MLIDRPDHWVKICPKYLVERERVIQKVDMDHIPSPAEPYPSISRYLEAFRSIKTE